MLFRMGWVQRKGPGGGFSMFFFDLSDAIISRDQLSANFPAVVDENMGQAFDGPAGRQDRRRVEKDDHLLKILTLAASDSSFAIHFLMVAAGMSRIRTVTAG